MKLFLKFSAIVFVCATLCMSQNMLPKGGTDGNDETPGTFRKGERKQCFHRRANDDQNQRELRRVPAVIYDPVTGQWVPVDQAPLT
jgi:hypothetical protein